MFPKNFVILASYTFLFVISVASGQKIIQKCGGIMRGESGTINHRLNQSCIPTQICNWIIQPDSGGGQIFKIRLQLAVQPLREYTGSRIVVQVPTTGGDLQSPEEWYLNGPAGVHNPTEIEGPFFLLQYWAGPPLTNCTPLGFSISWTTLQKNNTKHNTKFVPMFVQSDRENWLEHGVFLPPITFPPRQATLPPNHVWVLVLQPPTIVSPPENQTQTLMSSQVLVAKDSVASNCNDGKFMVFYGERIDQQVPEFKHRFCGTELNSPSSIQYSSSSYVLTFKTGDGRGFGGNGVNISHSYSKGYDAWS